MKIKFERNQLKLLIYNNINYLTNFVGLIEPTFVKALLIK